MMYSYDVYLMYCVLLQIIDVYMLQSYPSDLVIFRLAHRW